MAKKGWVYDFSHNSQDFFSLFKLGVSGFSWLVSFLLSV